MNEAISISNLGLFCTFAKKIDLTIFFTILSNYLLIMKSLMKFPFIMLILALMVASCSKESTIEVSTLEDQLGAPGELNGYIELVPGAVKIQYDPSVNTIAFNAKVKTLKAGDSLLPDVKIQLLDEDKNSIADFELTYDSKETLSANLKQVGNVANLQFCQKDITYDEEAAINKINEWNGKAKYIAISMTDGYISPVGEEKEEVNEEVQEEMPQEEEIETPSTPVTSGNNIDEFLDEYENYVTKMSGLSKRMMSGDISALNEYQSLMESAERLDEKLESLSGQMTPAQANRMNKIIQKSAGL